MRLAAYDGGTVTLVANAGQEYAVKALEKDNKRQEIADAIATVTGARVRVSIGKATTPSLEKPPPPAKDIPPPVEEPPPMEEPPPADVPPKPRRRRQQQDIINDPIVQETLKLFEGQILNVETRKNA